MTAPSLGPTFGLHSAGKVAGATGALTSPVNMAQAVRNGAGDYTLTLGTEIDATNRHVSLTLEASGTIELSPAGDTDGTFQVLTKNAAGAATDLDFQVAVFRTSVPS